ncbi:hypothetical protein LTS14_004384 [Recurvomyces mirabilis]|uniref:uncharacterized protein n=1 Tax=Recurvomyces mirabilis TaxID=574656 RepID=UPI002DE12D48|nr:hypothetical protein LTS14_004384 [Recurvomyces mirabilis]
MSGTYELNKPYRDPQTREVYSIQESGGSLWKVYESGKPSSRLPATAQAYFRPAQGAAQPDTRSQPRPVPVNTPSRSSDVVYSSSLPSDQQRPAAPARPADGRPAQASRGAASTSRGVYASSPGTVEGITSFMNRLDVTAPGTQTSAPTAAVPSITRARDLGNGVTALTAADTTAGVHTNWRFGPTQTFGDHSYRAKTIMGSDNEASDVSDQESDESDDSRRQGKKPIRSRRTFRRFSLGDVIETRLVPAPPDSVSTISMLTLRPETTFPGGLHAGVRRFVVMDPNIHNGRMCSALPIKTYNGMGVSAPNVYKSHHAVIYTEPLRPPAPDCSPAERPRQGSREAPMQRQPILVVNRDRTRPLDPMSRLDFFDITHFDTSLRGLAIYGHVHPEHLARLASQRANVWNSFAMQTGGTPPVAPQQNRSTRRDQRTRTSSMSAQATDSRTAGTGPIRPANPAAVVAGPSTLRPSTTTAPPRLSSDGSRLTQSRSEFESLRALVMSNATISAEAIQDYLRYLDQLAQHTSRSRPPVLTMAQAAGLARDAPERVSWFIRVHGVLGI